MVTKHTSADLKAKYYRVLELSIIVSLVVVIAAFRFTPSIKLGNGEIINVPDDVITDENVAPTEHLPKPVAPSVPKVPIEETQDKVLDDADIGPTDLDPNATVGPPKFKETVDESKEFIIVEDNPQPVGGLAAIQKLVMYPEMAQRAGVEGIVTVVAFVDENGNVVKTEILKSIGAGCDEAAQYAVANTKFIPGKQRDKAVRARVSIPVRFRLTK